MNTSSSNDIFKQGSSVIDNAADKMQSGIRSSQQSAKEATETAANKVDEWRTKAKDGVETVKDTIQRTRQSVSDSSEALVSYTKENPVKALLIAGATGAFLWTLLKAIAPSRD